MGSGSSNKPIVFVFGAKKGDADARKKNLSAINTQVAYRAHERRREKNLKSRQRAQAKEDEKVDHSTLVSDTSPTSSTKVESTVDFNRFSPPLSLQQTTQDESQRSTMATSQSFTTSTTSDTVLSTRLHLLHSSNASRPIELLRDRRESDLVSSVSSDRDTVSIDASSASPSSARQLTPATDLSSSSPMVALNIHGYFDSSLDPFFKLPAVASDREKWLVQFCRSALPTN